MRNHLQSMSSRYGCREMKSQDPIVLSSPACINLLPPVSIWATRSIMANFASRTNIGLVSPDGHGNASVQLLFRPIETLTRIWSESELNVAIIASDGSHEVV